MARFISVDRDTQFLFPPSVQEWLPEDHLARFIVDIVEQLDLSGLEQSYAGRGSDAHHPAMLVALLIYGYATGTFSSRALERASYDSIAFRYITANTHPDHDTINSFRQRFLKQIEAIFIQVLCYAQAMGILKLGTVSLDGTKVHANASRHSAMSYGQAKKLEAKLKAEVAELMRRAEAANAKDLPEGLDLPEELIRREQRLAAIAVAKAKIEARVQVEAEAAYAAKLAHHAGSWGWLRAGVQRPSRRGHEHAVGGGAERDASDQRQAASAADARTTERLAHGAGPGQDTACRYRVRQRGQRQRLCAGEDPPGDRSGSGNAPSFAARTLYRTAAIAKQADAVGGDASSPEDAPRAPVVRLAQVYRRARVRIDQARHEVPAILVARDARRPRRMESGVSGLEREANERSFRLKRGNIRSQEPTLIASNPRLYYEVVLLYQI